MRSIKKLPEPKALADWKDENKSSPQLLTYRGLTKKAMDAIRESLLKEQGYLCAYTLMRLNGVNDFHIEHVNPQNAAPEKVVDYGNMAGCFPKDGGNTSYGYGAPIKGKTEVTHNVNFVSPHTLGCENRFEYDKNGGVKETNGDKAAKSTIEILNLNHEDLQVLRRRAIERYGLAFRHRSTRKRYRGFHVNGPDRLWCRTGCADRSS